MNYIQIIEKKVFNDVCIKLAEEFDRDFERQAFFNKKWKASVYTDYENGLPAELAQYQYNGKMPEKWTENQLLEYKKQLTNTFKRLPKYEGVVYRNLSGVPDNVMQQWTKEGAKIVWDSFSSTTTSPENFKDRNIQVVISCKNGRTIGDLSMHPNEKEVVLLPGTRLQIMDVKKQGVKTIIEADEV